MGQDVNSSAIDLRDYVAEISKELTQRIEHQRDVLTNFIDERQRLGRSIDYCPLIDCRSKQRLRDGVREAIAVIEETRGSFKSRRLEELRVKLTGLLTED
jgi:hypothetical protein